MSRSSKAQISNSAMSTTPSTVSSATQQDDSTSFTTSSFNSSHSFLDTSAAHDTDIKPIQKERKPLPMTPNQTPRKSRPKKQGPHKNSGPRIPTAEELVASGIANAKMMDKESGLLDLADLPDSSLGAGSSDLPNNEFGDAENEDNTPIPCEYGPPESTSNPMSLPAKSSVHSKHVTKKGLPLDPNGRFTGRQLVMWHRPRMIEKLILHLQYECHRRGLIIPWDHVVHRLCPGSSGQSAIQHLSKLRDVLVSEGHMVPPLLGKVHVKQAPEVRGFIQDEDADDVFATRIVRWGEKIEDRKVSLVVPGLIRGSGNYRKDGGTGLSRAVKTKDGSRRNRLPVEIQEVIQDRVRQRGRGVKKAPPISEDTSDSDSDGNYDPSTSAKKRKYGLRKVTRTPKCFDSNSDSDEAFIKGDASSSSEFESPTKKQRQNMDQSPTPKLSKLITLKLSPGKLAKLAESTGGFLEKCSEDEGVKLEEQDSGNEQASTYCADTTYQQQLSNPDMEIIDEDLFYPHLTDKDLRSFAGVIGPPTAFASDGFFGANILRGSHTEVAFPQNYTFNTPQRSATADVFRNMSLSNSGYLGDSFQDVFDDGEDSENIPPISGYSTTIPEGAFGNTTQCASHIPIVAQYANANLMHNYNFTTLPQNDADTENSSFISSSQQGQHLGYSGNKNLALQFLPSLNQPFPDGMEPLELSGGSSNNKMDDVQHEIPRDTINEHPTSPEENAHLILANANAEGSDWESEYYGESGIGANF